MGTMWYKARHRCVEVPSPCSHLELVAVVFLRRREMQPFTHGLDEQVRLALLGSWALKD